MNLKSGRHPILSELPVYVMVDVETAGPYPPEYSMLSIGACTISTPRRSFYVELKPDSQHFDPKALEVSGLPVYELEQRGLAPQEAMQALETWLGETLPGRQPVFVAFNAVFDWMFIANYFERYLGHNPFGHSALDIKSFYMGMAGVPWAETSMRNVSPRYLDGRNLSHNALDDALVQAEIFEKMLEERTGLNIT